MFEDQIHQVLHDVFSNLQIHEHQPFKMKVGWEEHSVSYVPGESNTYVFGGNSNWRGPIWLPGKEQQVTQ